MDSLDKWKVANPFDAIAFTGISGAALGFPLSALMNIPMLCVRKEVKTHSAYKVEGVLNIQRYVIVDDCIASGATIKAICNAIESECLFFKETYGLKETPKPVGIYLYNKLGGETTTLQQGIPLIDEE